MTHLILDVWRRPTHCLMFTRWEAIRLWPWPLPAFRLENCLQTLCSRFLPGDTRFARRRVYPSPGDIPFDIGEPIYGLVALGLVHPDKVQKNATARDGDVLVLGKPLGIGILGAAANRAELDSDGYRQMVETATQLNSVGTALAELDGVHAMTDVTGFGLLGHLLEVCRGANLRAILRHDTIPVLPAARDYAEKGYNTGAANRNWSSYGENVGLPDGLSTAQTNLLRDPQTSGGLLVACAAAEAERVVAEFHQAGHTYAATIGKLIAGRPFIEVTMD